MTMNWESAELTKYAANGMLAARISFMNEMTILCEALRRRHRGHSQGHRLRQPHRPGVPPRRLRVRRKLLPQGRGRPGTHLAARSGYENLFVNAIQTINNNQKKRFVEKIEQKLGRPIAGAKIAVWGLAFKADTDDIRESAALDVIRYLLDKGAHVKATDPKAMENMKQIFKDEVEWSPDPVSCAAGADAVALLTDWPQYTHAAVPQDRRDDEHPDHLRRPQLPASRRDARDRVPVLPHGPPGGGEFIAAEAPGMRQSPRMTPLEPIGYATPIPATRDVEHLRLLSIFHYIVGGLIGFIGCFPIIYAVFGLLVVFGKVRAGQPAAIG